MTDITSVHDELAIRRVLAEYCHRCDDGDHAALAEGFAPDGAFAFAGDVIVGRSQLVGWFDRNHPPVGRGKHLTFNTVVDLAGDRARALSDFVFLRLADGTPTATLAGRYRDDLVRAGDRWVIERRDVEVMRPPST